MAQPDPSQPPATEPAFDKHGNRGLAHLANATRFSLRGLAAAVRFEAAFRQELAAAVVLVPAAFFVGRTPLEIGLLIAAVLWVLAVELLNSAVEATVDRAGLEFDPLAARAKDLGSAAVLVSLLMAGTLWTALLVQNVLPD